MNTRLTLRLDAELVRAAKADARRRGKSVSRIPGEFSGTLASAHRQQPELPPITASLVGILKDRDVQVSAYPKHLREKFRRGA